MRYAPMGTTMALLVIVGCSDDDRQQPPDAAIDARQAAQADAAPPDAPVPDARPPDAAPPDAAPPDAPVPDARPPDAAPPDAPPLPDAAVLDPALAPCGCTAASATCSLPGAAQAEDEAGGTAAGDRLETCANLEAIAGYTVNLSGYYRIDQGIVLPPRAKLVGGQALALDDRGRPAMNEEGPAGCEAWGHEQCWEPVQAPAAVPTVIDATALCSEGGCSAYAAITLQAGSQLSRFTLRQDAASGLESGFESSTTGISLAGKDALVSEVDVVGASTGVAVAPCHEHDVTEGTDGVPACAVPFTTGARVASSIVRYTGFLGTTVLSCAGWDAVCFDGVRFDVAFDGNVFVGEHAVPFMRTWHGTDDAHLDVTTSDNRFVATFFSLQTRYGGDRNTLTWSSRGDRFEDTAINIETCGDGSAYCNGNSITARFEDVLIRGNAEGAIGIGGTRTPFAGGLDRGNGVRVTLDGADVEGYLSCWGNDDWNEGLFEGSVASILAENRIGLGYVPAECTADRTDVGPAFVDRWLVLGMYDGREAALEEALPDLLADGEHTLDTFLPALGDVLGLPAEGEFVGPGEVPEVALLDTSEGQDAAAADLDAWFRNLCKPPGELWWSCASSTHEDELPPGNAAAYLFTYVDNLSGGALPVELAVAADDRVVIWLRGLDGDGPAQTFSVEAFGVGGPGTVHQILSATLPEGRSLLTMLVVDRDQAWGARLALLDPTTRRALESEGLVRHTLSATAPASPPEVKVYGCDGNVGDFLADEFQEPGSLLGLTAVVPPSIAPAEFQDRLFALDPEMPTPMFAAETYDAVVVTALAAEIARSHAGTDIARYMAGVTTRGTKCTSFAACRALIASRKDIDYDGVSGPIEFAPEGEPTRVGFMHLVMEADNTLDWDRVTPWLGGDASLADANTPVPPSRATPAPATGLQLGALFPLSGGLSFLGPAFSAGAELALADINAAGGVNGRPVEMLVRNSNFEVVFDNTDELLAAGVGAIIGPDSSSVALSIIDQVVEAGVVLFSPSNTLVDLSSDDDRGLYFRTVPGDSMQGRALAELVVGDGVRRVGVISSDHGYAQGITEALLPRLVALGIAEGDVFVRTYTLSSEIRAHVDALADFGPEGVVVIGLGESIDAFRLLNEAGIGPRRVIAEP